MPRVFIPPQLRTHTGVAECSLAGSSVREIVDQLDVQFPGIKSRLCLGEELAPTLQVSVDGVLSRRGLDAKVTPQSEIHFLPIFGGG
jgi:molybdopterin converting factor small subunit